MMKNKIIFDENNVKKNMVFLTGLNGRSINSNSNNLAKEYIISSLKKYNFITSEFKFNHLFKHHSNIIAKKSNSLNKSPQQPKLLLSAHFDSVKSSQGANDNASGVCSLLEIARIISVFKQDVFNNIELIFFNGEENGFVGSKAYAKYIKSNKIPILGLINFDMVGYSSSNHLFIRYGNNSVEFANKIYSSNILSERPPVLIKDVGCGSDDYSFENLGFNAVLVIGEYPSCSMRHGHNDNINIIDYSVIESSISIGLIAAKELLQQK